jgi:hypothetical protein
VVCKTLGKGAFAAAYDSELVIFVISANVSYKVSESQYFEGITTIEASAEIYTAMVSSQYTTGQRSTLLL